MRVLALYQNSHFLPTSIGLLVNFRSWFKSHPDYFKATLSKLIIYAVSSGQLSILSSSGREISNVVHGLRGTDMWLIGLVVTEIIELKLKVWA